jgi:hypothetical protein
VVVCQIPPGIPVDGCVTRDGLTLLLYAGIAPSREESSATLRSRIKGQHYAGNAYGSTLRLTLGCLLAERLGFSCVASGAARTSALGEGVVRVDVSECVRVLGRTSHSMGSRASQ